MEVDMEIKTERTKRLDESHTLCYAVLHFDGHYGEPSMPSGNFEQMP